ncbi:unnamed protein product [Brassica rapa]|uniref:Uncharacterized protein n=1 Tax=Brassica campestris TaxID=3711 RepID=A0A8D9D4L9_BRACM|nr:unnamed protein product [Brassica rapa]
MLICVVSVLIYVPIGNSPRGPKSPEQSTGKASVLSPRTSVLICVLMDSHGPTDDLCVLTDTHGRPVCADGHPRTSRVCLRTPTNVLCVLNRQPTWAKITQTVHGMAQRADSKDQRADMCTDGQPRMSCVNIRCVLTETHGHTQTATDVLCVLTDSHRRPMSTNSHGHTVCAGGHPGTFCVHGRPVCAGGHPQTSFVPRGPKSAKQSTGRASVLCPKTNVLICVLMDSHRRPVCADGNTLIHTDSHRRPVCAGGHPRTSCAKITRTVHKKGHHAESKDQRADMSTDVLCVLKDTYRHTRTATDVMCVLTDSHRQPRTSCVCWRTPTDVLSTDVLCLLADTHGRPVCTEQTAHVGQNHPNSPREGSAC